MSSPLDLTKNGPDDGDNPSSSRRSKRDLSNRTDSRPATSTSLVSMANSLVMLPVFMLYVIVQATFRFLSTYMPDGNSALRRFLFSSAEENRTLNELPAEQERQQREIDEIRENQVLQRQKLGDLRRRIEALEERRKRRHHDGGGTGRLG